MTNATIFGGEDNTPDNAAPTSDAQLFTALVGENQKYKTPDDLAKAYSSADQFIETLKEDNRKLREQVTQAKTIDEVLERMSKQNVAPVDDNPPVQGFSSEDVQQLVEKTLIGREATKTKTDNLLLADKLMKDRFGEKAEEMFKQRAANPEKARILMELAAADPAEFVSLFAGTPVQANNMDSGSVNTTSVTSNGGNRAVIEGTKEWAAKVRKENPNQYWSQEFQHKLQQTVTKNPSLYFG
tara:strand:- start:508 stop:1230 length:723 start_codon:yes stop_codon:yes gene_type:complete